MRTARIAIVPLLAISLAACGKSAGDAAPGAGDPDSPVSTIVDPGAQQRVEPTPQPVQPEPGTVDPHPVAWDGVDVGDDDRTLTFTFVGGVDTCYALGHVEVDYGTEAVTLTLYEGTRAEIPPDTACIEIGVYKSVTIKLDEPLAGRTLVDGAA
ncbi:MAG TPA: hypothetical protein VJN50_09445 [Actinomycetota bacterium]|nr:hypothetical protein [Actinomycetota bacterium]